MVRPRYSVAHIALLGITVIRAAISYATLFTGDMEVQMKALLLTLATVALVGPAALAADSPTRLAPNAYADCIPGMTSAAPVSCSLPGYHWVLTTHYLTHGETRTDWMLLPNG
jgi:hypothetical protein